MKTERRADFSAALALHVRDEIASAKDPIAEADILANDLHLVPLLVARKVGDLAATRDEELVGRPAGAFVLLALGPVAPSVLRVERGRHGSDALRARLSTLVVLRTLVEATRARRGSATTNQSSSPSGVVHQYSAKRFVRGFDCAKINSAAEQSAGQPPSDPA